MGLSASKSSPPTAGNPNLVDSTSVSRSQTLSTSPKTWPTSKYFHSFLYNNHFDSLININQSLAQTKSFTIIPGISYYGVHSLAVEAVEFLSATIPCCCQILIIFLTWIHIQGVEKFCHGGFRLIYLREYFLELNPIKVCFSQIKRNFIQTKYLVNTPDLMRVHGNLPTLPPFLGWCEYVSRNLLNKGLGQGDSKEKDCKPMSQK
ncbi:hypothetical protein VP01_1011g1 [Puccinia sorghi]|uniref:Uncharacterized protein n=1 Tax=Puccinia sorghi TaxID=27349 RepID=A0A0L6VVC1_9BASI|nr:hypothetical protein VP01_1011g1 [Puccinia sorghi]